MMHTLAMDMQIMLHASWWPVLSSTRLIKQVAAETPILNTDTFSYAKDPITTVRNNLRSAIYGVDIYYYKPVATWHWYNSKQADDSNSLSPTTSSSTDFLNDGTQSSTNTSRDTGPRCPITTSPTADQQHITRAKQEGLITITGHRLEHFAHGFTTFGGKHMCTNFVTENFYCRRPRGQCHFAHFTSLEVLNQQDRTAVIAWVNCNPNVKWRLGKGPSTSRGNN